MYPCVNDVIRHNPSYGSVQVRQLDAVTVKTGLNYHHLVFHGRIFPSDRLEDDSAWFSEMVTPVVTVLSDEELDSAPKLSCSWVSSLSDRTSSCWAWNDWALPVLPLPLPVFPATSFRALNKKTRNILEITDNRFI